MPVRAARPDDLPRLGPIEVAAGVAFVEVGLDEIAAHPPFTVAELHPALDDGGLFVSTDASDRPVGYLLLEVLDGCAHIEQVSVHPDAGGRGRGRSLLEQAAAWARARDLPAVTLTTFRDVAWNAPWYRRCGFRVLRRAEIGPELAARQRHEAELGLDPATRVAMRREVPEGSTGP